MRVCRTVVGVLALVASSAAQADRITSMSREDRCSYVAKLHVLGHHYHGKGTARADVKIHWHGDETPHEIDFVNDTLDAAYAESARQAQRGERDLPPEVIGDRAFEACMSEARS
ncbi:MAG: hypothetical protein MUF30_03810 [Burkholderiales bacterium]|nr:hypothetical protein [Burkholderiales bacterium]